MVKPSLSLSKPMRICLSLFLSLASLAAQATEGNSCPKSVTVTQSVAGDVPTGWTAEGTNKEHSFLLVSFYSDSPNKLIQLAPSKEDLKRKTATWNLPKSDTSYWVACEYSGTTAKVSKPIGSNAMTCTMQFDRKRSAQVVSEWHCTETK